MAENVVSFLLQKLDELLTRNFDLVRGVDSKIGSLREKLQLVCALLKDIDARRRDNDRIKVWVDQVRDVAFRAEDAIDRYTHEVQWQMGSMNPVGKLLHCTCGGLRIRHELGVEIEQIIHKFQDISDRRSEFGIELPQLQGEASSTYSIAPWQQNRAFVEETNVIGFDRHVAALVSQLSNEEQGGVVIPIVGMGGLGKTTLARRVYNDAKVSSYFHCRAWVYVSQKYRRRDLLKSLLEEFLKPNKDELEKMTEIDMAEKLKEYLQGKRYLLVIDDIWDGGAWNCIQRAIPDEKNGRAIIVTTRNEDVARYVDSTSPSYRIAHLDEEDSWKLLRSKVFQVNECINEELVELGRKMLKRCAGLPLAIIVLGGLLRRKPKSAVEWDNILKRIGYELHERENSGSKNVRRILALSYDDLPYYLRSCFLYFGLFPEDSEIDAQKLIRLWVAEGFIQRRGEQTMEEVAADYLEELVDRSMIQVVERNSWGRVAECRIHDLLLDLAISQGEEDKFLGHPAAAAATARRVAIHRGRSISESMPSSTDGRNSSSSPSRLLRSLLVFNIEDEATPSLQQVRMLVHNLMLLRVLDLQGARRLRRLPEQIGALVHLRYLGLEDTLVTELSSSVGKLRNLQTLRLPDYYCLLPDVVWRIETLRHVVGECLETQGLTVHAKCCCKGELQTLWGLKAGRSWVGRTTLGEFTNLRALCICGIVFSTHGALLSESLAELTRLNTLYLEGEERPTVAQGETLLRAVANHRVLFELSIYFYSLDPLNVRKPRPSLRRWCQAWCSSDLPNKEGESDGEGQSPPPPQFSPSLILLQLSGIPLLSKPEEMSSLESLPNLTFLRLAGRSASSCKSLAFSAAPAFPKLQELTFNRLPELEEWTTICNGAMPCLKRLEIRGCKKLKALPEGLQHITTLRELEIQYMPEEFTERIRRDEGEDWYKVQHIPSINII